ncbi:MAG: hypothetical protein SVV80_14240, partial [Planctomycetota bacterium]|nr:hypothetical protein [Planctomycetota bacterium]
KSDSTVNGRKLTVYTVSSAHEKRWKRLTVNKELKQIVRFEILEERHRVRYDFDYPSSGPDDIYAAGVPRNARIVDERTRDKHSSRLLMRATYAKERFDKAFRAILCEGRVDDKTGKMQVDSVTVYYQTPHQRRIDRWGIPKTQGRQTPNVYNLKSIEQYIESHSPSTVDITAPRGGVSYNLTRSTAVLKSSQSGEPGRFQNRLWQTYSSRYGRSVPDVTGPNGWLLGTRNVQPCRVHKGKVQELPVRWTVYLNPERDYIAERYEQWIGDFGEDWVPPEEKRNESLTRWKYAREPVKRTTSVIKYDKTPSGRWYARKQLIEIEGRDSKAGKRMRIIHLNTTCKFPDRLFSHEHFESQLKRPVRSN